MLSNYHFCGSEKKFWKNIQFPVLQGSQKIAPFFYVSIFWGCNKWVIYRWMDQWTDGPTDTPSYRDARTHLKTTSYKWGGIGPLFRERSHGKGIPTLLIDRLGAGLQSNFMWPVTFSVWPVTFLMSPTILCIQPCLKRSMLYAEDASLACWPCSKGEYAVNKPGNSMRLQ